METEVEIPHPPHCFPALTREPWNHSTWHRPLAQALRQPALALRWGESKWRSPWPQQVWAVLSWCLCFSPLFIHFPALLSLPYFLAKENDLGSLCFFICLRCITPIFLRNPACYNRNEIQKLWINKLTKYTNINVSSFLCRCGWSAKQGF